MNLQQISIQRGGLVNSSTTAFEKALLFAMRWEGGVNNDQRDLGNKGGRSTVYGITQNTFDQWNRAHGRPLRNIRRIKTHEANEIYFEEYYKGSRAQLLRPKIAIALFDTAVNMGVRRAVRMLQRAAEAKDDGIIGPNTIQKLRSQNQEIVIEKYLNAREQYYRDISTYHSNQVFLQGWLNRVSDLKKYLREVDVS